MGMRRVGLVITLAATGVTITAVALLFDLQHDEPRATRPPTGEAPVPDAGAEDGTDSPSGDGPSVATPGPPVAAVAPVTGEVVDGSGGGAIAGARVCALSDGKVLAETACDGAGTFTLSVPEGRRYTLDASAPGHVHARIQALWTGREIEAEPGMHVRIALERALRIRGTVVDQGGSGLGGASIRSASIHLDTERRSVLHLIEANSAITARTDALGRFEIGEVPPRGRSSFLVGLDGYGDGTLTVDPAAVPPPAEYVVRLSALPVLSGRTVAEDGRLLPGVAVMPLGDLTGLVIPGVPVPTTDAGVFRLPWRERASSVLAWGLGFVPAIAPVRPNDLLRGSLLEVRLQKAIEMRGVVRDDRGLAVEGARVRVHHYDMEADGRPGRLFAPFVRSYEEEPGAEWFLLPEDPGGRVCRPEAATDRDGAFSLAAAGTGKMRTIVQAEREGYIEARAGWTDGSPPMVIELVRAARLVITAVDSRTGARVPEFRVIAVHATAAMVSRTNPASGEPASAFVAPGSLKVTVEAPGYEAEAVTVDLAPGEEFARSLPLRPK
jgi:hypothetical protein